MNEPQINISIDGNRRLFQPGEIIAGDVSLKSFDAAAVKAVEISVLWYTEGKGDEDLDVREFRRIAADDMTWSQFNRPIRFEAVLPNSPLSYEGTLLKIRWCVRVRVFPNHGREVSDEVPFVLGEVQPVGAGEKTNPFIVPPLDG